MADVYIAPPAVPVLNTASSQADGLVHWFPHVPDYTPELDFITSQSGALADAAFPAPVETTFGWAISNFQEQGAGNFAYYQIDPFTPGWTQAGEVSLSAWHRPTAFVQYGAYPVSVGLAAAGGADRMWIGVQPTQTPPDANNRSRNIYLAVYGSGVNAALEDKTVKATANQWHHYVASCNEATGERTLYVNGVAITPDATLGNSDTVLTYGAAFTRLGVGGTYDGSGAAVQGNIKDVRIYNKALTASEVAAMYATATRWELWEGEPKFADETLEVFFFRRRRRLC